MNNLAKIRLVVVDDHPVVRDGLCRIHELDPNIQIVAEAGTVSGAVTAARQHQPEAMLMDIRLPDGDGIEACRQIKAILPAVRILILTSYTDTELVLEAMEAGADGYLLKESGAKRILQALHSILEGGIVFDPVSAHTVRRDGPPTQKNPLDLLAAREWRVLAEVAQGKTDKEVALALGLSTKTARNYLDRIFAKLEVHTRTEAALLFAKCSHQGRSRLKQVDEESRTN